MSVSKRIFLVLGAGAVIGLSSVAMAQAPKKSTEVTTLGEGEAIMIGPKKQRLHKSNSKVSAAKHQPEDLKDEQLKKAVDVVEGKIKGQVVVSTAEHKPVDKQ